MSVSSPDIEESWKTVLSEEFTKPYFPEIKQFILNQRTAGKLIFPPGNLIFNAFNTTPFSSVKVIILGQDPYHGEGQAHGLSFSVPNGITLPPSLKNIYHEIKIDLGIEPAQHGNLTAWAQQGVLLLNAILTVNANEPASHRAAGWEKFTDAVIQNLSDKREHLVFMLWGNFAKQKEALIDTSKHLVLKAAHPSPFSVHSGFYGCKHFSKCNTYLQQHGVKEIQWELKFS